MAEPMGELERLGFLTPQQEREQRHKARQGVPWEMIGGLTLTRKDDFYKVSSDDGTELFEICIRTKNPDVEAAFAAGWWPGVFIKPDGPDGILQVMVSFLEYEASNELLPRA